MKLKEYYGAGMILYHRDKDGISVLLEKRSDNATWAIPGGGFSESDRYTKSGRNLKATAIRELYEETEIRIGEEDAWLVKTYSFPFFTYAVYAAEANEKYTAKINHESLEAVWHSIDGIPKEANIMTRIEINDFRRRMR